MGCDIHTYVEFSETPSDSRKPYWKNFTRNGGSRNYIMFGVLAGVRFPEAQLYEPKGMPDDGIGYYTSNDYWLSVAPEAYPQWADNEGHTSLDNARRWVDAGYSVGEEDDAGRLRRVSGPDWHSHSWLTADELENALSHYSDHADAQWPGEGNPPAEWLAMLASMRAFEVVGQMTRLVFWFDN